MKRLMVLTIVFMAGFGVARAENAEGQALIKQARQAIAELRLSDADAKYKEAIDVIEQELDYDEAESKAARDEWKRLQSITQLLADGSRSLERQDYADAGKRYAEAIQTMTSYNDTIWDRAMAEAYYQWGMTFYRKDNTSEAAAKFREAIAKAPDQDNYSKALYNIVVTHYNDGLKYYRRRDFRSARLEYEQSVAVDPTFAKGYYMLALIAKMDNDADKAMDYYEKAIDNDPQYYIAWFGLGKLYADLGRMTKAVDAFARTIAINPTYQKAYFERGQAYLSLKEKSKAIADFQMALSLDDEYTLAYEALGLVYNEDHNYEETIRLLSPTKGTKTASYKTCYYLGQAYNETKNFEEALRCATNSLTQKSGWAPALFEKGRALAAMNQKTEAIAAFKQAAKDSRWKSAAEYEINLLTKWADR
ncbi:MAG: tetratricopeptide repeat protein [Lentisphaeria bacterium]|nr:tetratricopeptide repeat protein [Candidatus Neomarinimicrobiota bacterium]MCF7842250.1 tetratricopeptide repeat protein [Lentisphaeria bacterium]